MEAPKPSPLPPPLPPPPAPEPVQVPQQIVAPDAKPDIKIGTSKKASTSSARRPGTTGKATRSLSIGDNQGLSL